MARMMYYPRFLPDVLICVCPIFGAVEKEVSREEGATNGAVLLG